MIHPGASQGPPHPCPVTGPEACGPKDPTRSPAHSRRQALSIESSLLLGPLPGSRSTFSSSLRENLPLINLSLDSCSSEILAHLVPAAVLLLVLLPLYNCVVPGPFIIASPCHSSVLVGLALVIATGSASFKNRKRTKSLSPHTSTLENEGVAPREPPAPTTASRLTPNPDATP